MVLLIDKLFALSPPAQCLMKKRWIKKIITTSSAYSLIKICSQLHPQIFRQDISPSLNYPQSIKNKSFGMNLPVSILLSASFLYHYIMTRICSVFFTDKEG